MKNTGITLLLLVVAGTAETAQAMGAARAFAEKIFYSKTAALAAGTVVGTAAYASYGAGTRAAQLRNCRSSLPEEVQQELKELFAQRGFPSLHLVDAEDSDGPRYIGGMYWNGEAFLILPEQERVLLADGVVRGLFPLEDGMLVRTLRKCHATQVVKHELTHLVHNDGLTQVAATSALMPAALMSGKVARVAGRGKILTALTACASYIGLHAAFKKHARNNEFRADSEAAQTSQEALAGAQHLDFTRATGFYEDLEWPASIFSTHPPFDERIERLQQQARELEEKEMQARLQAILELLKRLNDQ